MALYQAPYKSNSGSSNVVSGTATSAGTVSSEFTCDTGLTTITKFIAWSLSGNTNQNTAVIIYDSALFGSDKFSTAGIQTTAAAQRPRASIGDAPTAYNSSIKSITSGVVTIKNSTNASNLFKGTVYWYAEGT